MSGQYSSSADYRKSRGIASGIHRNERIGMFEIKKNSTNDMFYLKVNEDRLIGTKFPTKEDAIAVLHGLFTGMDGKSAGMNAVIAKMVAEGRGIVEGKAAQSFNINILNTNLISITEVTGDGILSTASTQKLWNYGNDALRLWYGPYTGNAANGTGSTVRYPFDSNAEGGDYMRRFTTKVSVNGGSDITIAKPGGNTQPDYQNTNTSLGVDVWVDSGPFVLTLTITED